MAGLPHGVICTPEEYERSGDGTIHCLTRGDSIGLTVVTEAGLVSLIACSYVFFVIARNAIWRIRTVTRERLRIFHQPMDMLMFSLFFADVLQAIGAVMDIRWINTGKVEVGSFCDAQGIIQNVGETGVAMTTLAIAVFTFLGVWMGRGIRSMTITRIVLAAIWGFIGLVVIIGNTIRRPKSEPFQAPTPFWCWVSQDYMNWRILGEYLWFWLTLAFSLLIYIPLYLWSRGNIIIHDPAWWSFHFQHSNKSDTTTKARRKHSLVMAAYPFVYCLNILPLSVVRWITFIQGSDAVAPSATFAVVTIYGLSGFCNVVLLLTTKPESGLFAKVTHFSSGQPPQHESQLYESQTGVGELPFPTSMDADYYNTRRERVDADSGLGLDLGRLPDRGRVSHDSR